MSEPTTGQAEGARLFANFGIITQLAGAIARRSIGPAMGLSELSVLGRSIRLGDGETPSRLAAIFQLSKPSMTAIIAKLERKRWVEVRANADDARSKRVFVTAAGRNAHVAAEAKLFAAMAHELAGFDMRGVVAAVPAIDALKNHLDARRNAVDGLG